MALRSCSRTEAERFIEGGWVRVDGKVVDVPQFRVGDEQRVEVDAAASAAPLQLVTLLLHKPAGVPYGDAQRLLGAASHAPQDASGIRPVKRHFDQLVALMPMLEEAAGLAVYSQDPRIMRKLTEDERTIEQEVIAQVAGTLEPAQLARLAHGLTFNGKPLPPVKVSWQNETRLRFALKGIAPGQVPWMCEQVGLRVEGLRRIRIGRVPMAQLAPGQWRYLQAGERF